MQLVIWSAITLFQPVCDRSHVPTGVLCVKLMAHSFIWFYLLRKDGAHSLVTLSHCPSPPECDFMQLTLSVSNHRLEHLDSCNVLFPQCTTIYRNALSVFLFWECDLQAGHDCYQYHSYASHHYLQSSTSLQSNSYNIQKWELSFSWFLAS